MRACAFALKYLSNLLQLTSKATKQTPTHTKQLNQTTKQTNNPGQQQSKKKMCCHKQFLFNRVQL